MEMTFKKWKLLKNISINYNNQEHLCLSKFALKFGYSVTNPWYSELIKFLISNNIIIPKNTFASIKIVEINKDKLDELIEDNEIWSEFASYVHRKKLVYADI